MKLFTAIWAALAPNKDSLTDSVIETGWPTGVIVPSAKINGGLNHTDEQVSTLTDEINNCALDRNIAIAPGDSHQLSNILSTIPQSGSIAGLGTSIDPGDTDHDIEIAAGSALSSDNSVKITLAAPITKQADGVAGWVEGDNQSGMPSGIQPIANDTWYYQFIISKADGTTDAGFDTSITAANLLADATDYINYRMVWFFLTDGSANIIPYIQDGDKQLWDVPVSDYSANNPGVSAVTVALTTPIGVKTSAMISAGTTDASWNAIYYGLFTSLDITDTVPSGTAFDFLNFAQSGDNSGESIVKEVTTDTSSQIRSRISVSNADININIITKGFIYKRGGA